MAGVNPVHDNATLRAFRDGHPQSGIEDFMAWRFNPQSSLDAQGCGRAYSQQTMARAFGRRGGKTRPSRLQ